MSTYPAAALEGVDQVGTIGLILRVLPVNVETVNSQVLNQRKSAVTELLATCFSSKRGLEVGPVAPTTDRKDDLQVAVLLLELKQLVEVAKQLGAVGSNVSGVAELDIGPLVSEEDFTSLVVHVGEAVVDLGKFVGGEVGDKVLASVDGPVNVEDTRLVLHATTVAEITCMSVLVAMDGRSSLGQRGQRKKSGGV